MTIEKKLLLINIQLKSLNFSFHSEFHYVTNTKNPTLPMIQTSQLHWSLKNQHRVSFSWSLLKRFLLSNSRLSWQDFSACHSKSKLKDAQHISTSMSKNKCHISLYLSKAKHIDFVSSKCQPHKMILLQKHVGSNHKKKVFRT